MATFELAYPVVQMHEGGRADLPGDPGGPTNYGVSTALCRRLGIPLPETPEEAMSILRHEFWNPMYGMIRSQNYATKLFDDAVNQGPVAAVTILQRAMCIVGSVVKADGVFGNATLTGLSFIPENVLLPAWRQLQYNSYNVWISRKLAEREVFRNGLAKRAAWPDPDGSIAESIVKGEYDHGWS